MVILVENQGGTSRPHLSLWLMDNLLETSSLPPLRWPINWQMSNF